MRKMKSQVKCMIVGDINVGKTCMVQTYATNAFPEGFLPTVYDRFLAQLPCKEVDPSSSDDTDFYMEINDTTSTEENYNRERYMTYHGTDVLIMCFSVSDRTSMERISSLWMEEKARLLPMAPFILVGMKIDERDGCGDAISIAMRRTSYTGSVRDVTDYVTTEEGRHFAARLGAATYVECSAITGCSIKRVFTQACKAAVLSNNRKHLSSRMLISELKPTAYSKNKSHLKGRMKSLLCSLKRPT